MGRGIFQGKRLREAREARGLTGVTLSELVSVSSAAISQYETEANAPSHPVVVELAKQLRVDPSFFLRPSRDHSDRVIFWRSRVAATKLQRSRSIHKYGWLLDVCDVLSRHIEFPKVNIPTDNSLRQPWTLREEDIEDVASDLREQWRLGDGPIHNLVSAMERNGVIVARNRLDADHLDAFSEWRDDNSRPYVVLGSDKQSEARSRMDAAHELGHMILHRNVSCKEFHTSSIHKVMETQVARFASALLLPEASFLEDLYSVSLDAFRDLKARWRVSIAAMIFRARDLGVIDEAQARSLWIAMSRRKWRKCEPGDAESRPEEPTLIREAFDLLLDSGRLDPESLELELGIGLSDIEDVTGLPQGYLRNANSSPLKLRFADQSG